MGAHNHADLAVHIGHRIECATYGDDIEPANVAVECIDCSVVLRDADRPGDEAPDDPTPSGYWNLLDHDGHWLACISRPSARTVAVSCRRCGLDLLAFARATD